jgi:aminomethyltransferase
MVPFAGWSMPVQFAGALAEHQAARTAAALFDVSHMGQVAIRPTHAATLEKLVPSDILRLAPQRQRYTMFLNDAGGILDDIMVANHGDFLHLVVNAARTGADLDLLRTHIPDLTVLTDRALLALQGPFAAAVLARHAPAASGLPFMGVTTATIAGATCWISRSGYTGEDGFELSIPTDAAEPVALALLAEPEVTPAGLAARDTLRLEAGLCLYGNDIDETTTPIEADLAWTLGKRRRDALDFPGAATIAAQLCQGPARLRVGIRPDGRAPARAGTEIIDATGNPAGIVTSGGFAPTLGSPVSMGYVRRDLAALSTELGLMIRGQRHPARVVSLPFVPHRFAR